MWLKSRCLIRLIYLSFYNVSFRVHGPADICDLLRRDFHYFITDQEVAGEIFAQYEIEIYDGKSLKLQGHWYKPFLPFKKEAKIYQCGQKRAIFYVDGTALLLDFESHKIEVYGNDRDRLREVAYSTLLSISGKEMEDKSGRHKLHGIAFEYNQKTFILSMPSGGGKSSLLLEILKRKKIALISDDTPVIDRAGKILNFPTKMSVKETSNLDECFVKDCYPFKRFDGKTRCALDISRFPLFQNNDSGESKVFLCVGNRGQNDTKIEKVSKMKMGLFMIEHFLVGVGVPFIVEIYWDNSIRGYIKLVKIFISRLVTIFKLLSRSSCFSIEIGRNGEENVKHIFEQVLNE